MLKRKLRAAPYLLGESNAEEVGHNLLETEGHALPGLARHRVSQQPVLLNQ